MSSELQTTSRLQSRDLRSDPELKADGLNDDEVSLFRTAEQDYYLLLVELDEAEATRDFDKIVEIEEKLPVIEFRLKYQGKHPRDVPLSEMRNLVKISAETKDDSTNRRYHERIKNPATGVRAFCIACMGGAPGEVRHCPATTCPLWAFRLGTNPFFGKALPPVEEVEVEDDDLVEVEQDEAGGDAEE